MQFDDFIAELEKIPDPLRRLFWMILKIVDVDPHIITRAILAARGRLARERAEGFAHASSEGE